MKKISTREYRKQYILNLLPGKSNKDTLPYIANAEEVESLNKWMRLMVKLMVNEPILAKNITARAEQLKQFGGSLISLETVYVPVVETHPQPLVHLDLSYAVTKDVQFLIGGLNVTEVVSKSDKLTGLLTRFMKDLYAGHEDYFGSETRDAFVEEMFLIDDIEMVIDENSQFKVKVDRSLRDYLVALNSRLRVNA